MKYLNNYKLWKKINEELNDSIIVNAANEHEKEGRPQKAAELRSKVEPDYEKEFEFYFFPIAKKGNLVTFRAYLDNREDAVKASRILKVFNNLPGLPEVNNLWREIDGTHKSEGLVTVNYQGNSRFMFKPSAGYFVTHQPKHHANPRETEVQPIVLYYDHPYTQMMSGRRFLDYANFSKSGPSQIIKIYFDEKDKTLKADLNIDLNGTTNGMSKSYNAEINKILGGGEVEDTKKVENEDIEEYKKLADAIMMYEQRPKASLAAITELLKTECSKIINEEVTFILRDERNLSNIGDFKRMLKYPDNEKLYSAYVESEEDAKIINELIKTFILCRDYMSDPTSFSKYGKRSMDIFNHNTLLTEKRSGDIEVKAKFIPSIDKYNRIEENGYGFFGFKFDELPESGDNEIKAFNLNDGFYISLIDDTSNVFNGSKLFTLISKY